ncbi:MAG TPA: Flp pilus assembly protein CpaB [Candidatus Elarobacter sp.]|jgi:pilus assembly protein CpaB|nr:Flp pilus assembly protein CpaB [Candidatus Elarobacter sp.]
MVAARPRLDRRSTTLIIAAILALGTGLLTFNYLTSVGRSRTAVVAPRPVLIAARDIPARVQISSDMVTVTMRPGDAVDPDALNAPSLAIGRTAAITMPAGSTITASKIMAAQAQTLETRVPRGMRAIAIPIDRVKGVGALIQPGDHVDVIAVTPARQGQAPVAATILRDVPVLAMGTALETASGATPSPDSSQTVSLAVTPTQAKLLTLVDLNATLRLDLRAPTDDKGSKPMLGEPIDLTVAAQRVAAPMMPAAAPAAAPPAAAAPAAAPRPAAPAPVHHSGVEVINGDKVVTQ